MQTQWTQTMGKKGVRANVCMKIRHSYYNSDMARGKKPADNDIDPSVANGPNSQVYGKGGKGKEMNLDRNSGKGPPRNTRKVDKRGERPDDGDRESEAVGLVKEEAANVGDMSKEDMRRMLEVYSKPILGWLARKWPALRRRLMANPRLPLQMGVELTVGCVTKTLAEIQDRKDRFWNELDFYFSDLMLELVGDAMLVWLLSPVAMSGMGTGWMARLPKHAGQMGSFGLGQRAAGFAVKGVQFGMVGFASSVVGHGLTRWLVSMRDVGSEDEKERKQLAPILPTSLCWGGFMVASSNIRYQIVNGFEQRVLERFVGGGLIGAGTTFAVRFGNCYLGGIQWLPWARFWGVQ